MTNGTAESDWRKLMFDRLSAIEQKIDKLDDRLRPIENAVAVLSFKSTLWGAGGGIGGGSIIAVLVKYMGG